MTEHRVIRAVEGNGFEATSWRGQAVAIVEDLFGSAPVEAWDLLLDLRAKLVSGDDWAGVLDLFLAARLRLENDQYLPFYRLRRLLATSLRLECAAGESGELESILRRKHRSLEGIHRELRRHWFEHGLDRWEEGASDIRIVEQGAR